MRMWREPLLGINQAKKLRTPQAMIERQPIDESHFSGFVKKPVPMASPIMTKEPNLALTPSQSSEESSSSFSRGKPRINGRRAPPGSTTVLASTCESEKDPNSPWALNFGRQLGKLPRRTSGLLGSNKGSKIDLTVIAEENMKESKPFCSDDDQDYDFD